MNETKTGNDALYGLLGRYAEVEGLENAIHALRDEGYGGLEAFSPYPIDEVSAAIGPRSRKLTVASLVAALLAAAAGYWLIWYSAVVDYPFVVGGKPLHSWPPFALIAFVLAILAAVTVAFVGMLAACRLPRFYHPVFNVAMFKRATSDSYFLLVSLDHIPHGDIESLRLRLQELGAEEITEVPA